MILFLGIRSDECVRFIYKKMKRIWMFSGLIILLLIGTPIIIIAKNNPIAIFYVIIPIVEFVFFCFVPKMIIKKSYYNRIELSKEYLSSGVGQKYQLRDFSDVKIVKDWGLWYEIIFYFPYRSIDFICQKDLLVEGSIEEFEKLFEGLIVRNYEIKD